MKKAITLIEVMIVISIIAIFVALMLPTYINRSEHSLDKPEKVDLPAPRFVEEDSKGLQFSLIRDTKTKRLYALTIHGGLQEINETPLESISK